jgi:hypothetical protein
MPLSFKQAGSLFTAGPNITIFPSGNTFAISASSSGSGTIISGTNAGTGVPIFSSASGSNLVFRRILSGSNIGVYTVGNDIVISGTTGAINGVTGVTNIGGGSNVLSSVTGNILVARTISGSGGIAVFESGGNIIVRPTGLTASRLVISDATGGLITSDNFQIDNTNGTMSIGGVAAVSSTRLLLAAGSSTISQIRMNSFAATYGGASAGDVWYNSTSGNTLFFNKTTSSPTAFIFKDNNYNLTGVTNNRVLQSDTSGTINPVSYLGSLGIFNSITSTTISGLSELSVINTGSTVLIGTNLLNSSSHGTIPQLIVGKKYRFNAKGLITTTATSTGNLIAKMKLGSVLVASSTTILESSISSKYFEIDSTFTIRSQGASGTVVGSGKLMTDNQYLVAGKSPIGPITSLGSVTINTTNDMVFDFTLQNDTNVNNIYIINEATLEYLN